MVIGSSGGKGVELSGLRISFSIQKGATKSPNKCLVKVYNCKPETREKISIIGNVLVLKAGYEKDAGLITLFTGNVSRSLTTRQGPDWVTELELIDGLIEFRDSKTSFSFDAGAPVLQVLKSASSGLGLPVRVFPDGIESMTYPEGFAFVGRSRDAMDKACQKAGLEWSIQNREVQIIKKGGVYKQKTYLISPETGLIGSPERESKTMTDKAAAKRGITSSQAGVSTVTKTNDLGEQKELLQIAGYKIKTLLLPMIEPASYVQLKSRDINSQFFRVEEITHTGDTHGQEWQSEISLRFPK